MTTMRAISVALILLVSIVQAEDECNLKPDPGPCDGAFRRWFYSAATKTCESFVYGGCQGVVPFTTERECQHASCDPCVKKPDTGPCEALFKRWFFSNRKGRCQSFTWGGCDGSVPFETLRECRQAKCEPKVSARPSPKPLNQRCSIKPDRGPCRQNLIRWFWDDSSKTCRSFQYGGCFGKVPFRWRWQCLRAKCGGRICRTKPDPGPCDGSFPRWFYNSDTDACESFAWGGCGGTVPFATKQECEASKCIKNRCRLEPDSGPCKAFINKYFFNQEAGKCESFVYGGCLGLVPYDSLAQCERAGCEPDKCRLRAERGRCYANITKWRYDASRGECTSFMWGGCDGVVPFDTKQECVDAGCVKDACRLKPDPGFCRAFFLKWFWNAELGRCDTFIWGGCGGVVPFDTRAECEEALCGGVKFGNNDPALRRA